MDLNEQELNKLKLNQEFANSPISNGVRMDVDKMLARIDCGNDSFILSDTKLSISFLEGEQKIIEVPLSILKDALEFYASEKMHVGAIVVNKPDYDKILNDFKNGRY